MSFIKHRVTSSIKLPLFVELDEDFKRKVKWFKYWHDRVYYLLDDNKVFAFGSNNLGLLGIGHKNEVTKVEEIVELRDQDVVDIVPSKYCVFAITKTGMVYAWGDVEKKLFDNETGSSRNVITKNINLLKTNLLGHCKYFRMFRSTTRPVLVNNLIDIISIKCGKYHTMALDKHGRVFTWGRNVWGQIGDEKNSIQLIPYCVNLFGNVNINQIECGSDHSLAVTAEGDVYAWGRIWTLNEEGSKRVLTKQMTPLKLSICPDKVKAVVASHEKSFFLSTAGNIYIDGNEISRKIDFKNIRFREIYCINNDLIYNSNEYLVFAITEKNNCYIFGQTKDETCKRYKTTYLNLSDAMAEYCRFLLFPLRLSFNISVSQKITNSFDESDYSDFVFEFSNEEKIFAHRLILSLFSDYMRTQLKKDWCDQDSVKVLIYPYPLYYRYVKFIYTRQIDDDLSLEDLFELYDLANCCLENELKEACFNQIQNNLNIKSSCQLFEFSLLYELKEFNCIVSGFIWSNFQSIPSSQIQEMRPENCQVLMSHFSKIASKK